MQVTDIPFSQYCESLRRSGRKSAAKTYMAVLNSFSRWLLKTYGRDVNTVIPSDIEEYMGHLKNPRTANLFKAAIKGYIRFRAASMPFGDPNAAIENQRLLQVGLVQNKKVVDDYRKKALTPGELKSFLSKIENSDLDDVVYPLAVVISYFGARPIEIEQGLKQAKINWKDNSMIIETAKTKRKRFLAWSDEITPYLEYVNASLPLTTPGEYLTKRLRRWQKANRSNMSGGIRVGARTLRYTFQTNMMLEGVSETHIDKILGHISKASAIGDIYTDRTAFEEQLRDVMVNRHFMLKYNVV